MKKLVMLFCIVCGMISLFGRCGKREIDRNNTILLNDTTVKIFLPYQNGNMIVFRSLNDNDLDTMYISNYLFSTLVDGNSQTLVAHLAFNEIKYRIKLTANKGRDYIQLSESHSGQDLVSFTMPKTDSNYLIVNNNHFEIDTLFFYKELKLNNKNFTNVVKVYNYSSDTYFIFSYNFGLIYFTTTKKDKISGRYILHNYLYETKLN